MLTYYDVFSWDDEWVACYEAEEVAKEVAVECAGYCIKREEEPPLL